MSRVVVGKMKKTASGMMNTTKESKILTNNVGNILNRLYAIIPGSEIGLPPPAGTQDTRHFYRKFIKKRNDPATYFDLLIQEVADAFDEEYSGNCKINFYMGFKY